MARISTFVNMKAFLTMLENTNEQGLVSLTVPPVNWDLGMEWLRNPDIQLTVKDTNQRGDFFTNFTDCMEFVQLQFSRYLGKSVARYLL